MPYYDPSLKEFDNYYQARSASKRERAENWAVAIGLQNANIFAEHSWFFRNALVRANYENPLKGYHRDLEPLERFFRNLIMGERNELKNRYLLVGISDEEKAALGKGGKATSKKRSGKSGQKKVVRKAAAEKSGQKTVDRILVLLRQHPELTQKDLVQELGINRSAIQRHLSNLKSAGKLRRVGPDKGGHWEVIG